MSETYNECPICLSNARLPVATRCGHIFCWECLKNWVNIKGRLECPICKSGIKLDEVVKLYSGNEDVKSGEVDDRPQNQRTRAEYVVEPGIFRRFMNNFGFYGYTNDYTLRPPSQKEVQRNILSLIILILGIVFIIYIFN